MSPSVVFHPGPRPHIMTGRAVLRSCAKLLAACGIVGGLLAGQLGADPAEVAEAARSSKPKEIVVVGSKIDVSGDDGAQLTTEATATTAGDGSGNELVGDVDVFDTYIYVGW